MRKTKGVYKTKGNEQRQKAALLGNKTVVETETGIITFYHEKTTE
jgi:hypothetical protein